MPELVRIDALAREAAVVVDLFTAVFTASAGAAEGRLIGDLVRRLMVETPAQDLRCVVAREGGRVVGGLFFSRLQTASQEPAFLLAPVAVATDRQGEGLGQALIRDGLRALRDEGVTVVVTYGDPAFYGRVGFRPVGVDRITPPYALSQPEGWLAQCLVSPAGTSGLELGPVACVDAFRDPVYW